MQASRPAYLPPAVTFITTPAGIVERLLLAGYVVDSMAGPLADGTEGGTALHLAAAQGHGQVVSQLLRSSADPRLLDFSGRNALDLAVLHGHLELVPPLLEAGCWFTNGSGGLGVGGGVGLRTGG